MKLPIARTTDLVVNELGKELLIYDLITNQAYQLNETSMIVFQACSERQTFAELKTQHKFTDDIIFLALDSLKKENLLEGEYVSPFAGMSRRQVVRQVGLASMLALPVISALVAPTPAHAASGSGAALLAACTNPSTTNPPPADPECQSGNCRAVRSNGGTLGNPVNPTGSSKCCYAGGTSSQNRDTGNSFGAVDTAGCNSQASGCCSGQTHFVGADCQCV